MQQAQHLATKEDIANLKTEMARTIYIVGLVQYLAMLVSLIAIIKFLGSVSNVRMNE